MNTAFRVTAVILLAMLGWGCSHTIMLTPQSPPQDVSRANRRVAGRTMKVVPQMGAAMRATSIEINTDSISFCRTDLNQRVFLPMYDVREIYARDHARGALEGLGIGFLVGVGGTIGTWAYFGYRAHQDPGWGTFNEFIVGIVYSSFWLAGSPLVGAGLGAAIGQRITVEFQTGR